MKNIRFFNNKKYSIKIKILITDLNNIKKFKYFASIVKLWMPNQCSTTWSGGFWMCTRDDRKFVRELTKAHPVSGLEIASGFAMKKFAESEICQFNVTISVKESKNSFYNQLKLLSILLFRLFSYTWFQFIFLNFSKNAGVSRDNLLL